MITSATGRSDRAMSAANRARCARRGGWGPRRLRRRGGGRAAPPLVRTLPSAVGVALSLCLLGIGGAALGSVMLLQTIPELAHRSTLIVVGRVETMRSEWNARRTRINTRVGVLVGDVVYGVAAVGDRIAVTIPGGVVGDIGMRAHGAPEFHIGEEALLFLRGTSYRMEVVGWSQGQWTLAPPATAAKAAGPPMPGGAYDHRLAHSGAGRLALVRREPDGSSRPVLPPAPRTVADLKAEIREAIRSPAPVGSP